MVILSSVGWPGVEKDDVGRDFKSMPFPAIVPLLFLDERDVGSPKSCLVTGGAGFKSAEPARDSGEDMSSVYSVSSVPSAEPARLMERLNGPEYNEESAEENDQRNLLSSGSCSSIAVREDVAIDAVSRRVPVIVEPIEDGD